MNRIPVEDAIKAMREGDVKPRRTRNKYFIKGECGCLLGTLVASKKGRDKAVKLLMGVVFPFENASTSLGVSRDYALGLSDAWEESSYDRMESPDYFAGHEDGAAIWEAAVEAGLAEIDPVAE